MTDRFTTWAYANWKPRVLRDSDGLAHMGLTNADAASGVYYVPCRDRWTNVEAFVGPYRYAKGHVTCVTCAMFVVHDGRISLWVPS